MSATIFFSDSEKQAIATYVEANIIPELKDKYIDFLEVVEDRIRRVFTRWLGEIQQATLNRTDVYQTMLRASSLDIDCTNLIQDVFCSKFGFTHLKTKTEKSSDSHCITNVMGKNLLALTMNVAWTPKNLHAYSPQVQLCRQT